MPSHVTHLLHADDLISRSGLSERLAPVRHEHRSYLVLGAQGPDIFYHNQRRRPTGLAYGSLMHRRGYGTFVASMWQWAREHDLGPQSWAGALLFGFASHAILDRHTHPFINAHSGWVESGKPETRKFRSMHPFLERLIDVAWLSKRRGCHPNELNFFQQVSCGDEPPEGWTSIMAHALCRTYAKAERDRHLVERLTNAYLDTMGFYRYTNHVDAAYLREGLARAERGEVGARWLSIVHPPRVPAGLDVLNVEHREWPHPCSSHELHASSFEELYEAAVEEGVETLERVVDLWFESEDVALPAIESAVANWNLSDGRPSERPCTKRHAVPLPLPEAQEALREQIRSTGR